MYVVLFRQNYLNPVSWLIRIVTGSHYTHAAILLDNGDIYDASESRGSVAHNGTISEKNREVIIFKINDTTENPLEHITPYIGREYDWKGIIGWLFRIQDKKRFYCFEFVWEILKVKGIVSTGKKRITANDLIEVLSNASYVGSSKTALINLGK